MVARRIAAELTPNSRCLPLSCGICRDQPKIFQPLRCLAVGLRIDLDRHDKAGILGREMAAMTFIDAPEYPGNDEGATTRFQTGFVR